MRRHASAIQFLDGFKGDETPVQPVTFASQPCPPKNGEGCLDWDAFPNVTDWDAPPPYGGKGCCTEPCEVLVSGRGPSWDMYALAA